ncbi:MAG: ABC transporter ATP-binding protein, partial [Rubrobacteridae bacterium]|nr:ABC transporter ATP-binding protein [Rubrobacteridae bacterium]
MIEALELDRLAKTYKTGWRNERKAVTDISLSIPEGTVFGLLGPNGAGKTTTIKLALGFLKPDSGTINIFGERNGVQARKRIGFLPEQPYFYPYLNGQQALDFYAKLFGIKRNIRNERVLELLKLVGLSDALKLPINKYSKGMMQRLGIAQALINNPDLLIVDEPASGLDPLGQVEMRALLKSLNDEGKSILLSSHYLSEVENICHEVAVINKGSVIARGKIEDLLDSGNIYRIKACGLPATWKARVDLLKFETADSTSIITIDGSELNHIIDSIRSSDGQIE